jgi:hypothetical protein
MASVERIVSVPFGGDNVRCTPLGRLLIMQCRIDERNLVCNDWSLSVGVVGIYVYRVDRKDVVGDGRLNFQGYQWLVAWLEITINQR